MKRVYLKNRWSVLAFALSGAIMLGAATGCNEDKDPKENEKVSLFVVVFDSKGGTPTPAQTVKAGEKIAKPDNPAKLFSIFEGWEKADVETSALWDFDTETVTDAMRLFARWHDKFITVSFNAKGGLPVPSDQIIKAGSKVSKPTDPELEGYIVTGWATEDNATSALWDFDTETEADDMTLYARWDVGIKLKTPLDNITVDAFPINFSWAKLPEIDGYTLKISTDASFAESNTLTIDVGDVNDYLLNTDKVKDIFSAIYSRRRQENLPLYWTVTPTVQNQTIKNQIRTILFSPLILHHRVTAIGECFGLWEFENASNLEKATIGNNLVGRNVTEAGTIGVPSMAGFTPVAGFMEGDGAVRIDACANIFFCEHNIPPTRPNRVDDYTILFEFRFSPYLQGSPFLNYDLTNTTNWLFEHSNDNGLRFAGYNFVSPGIVANTWYSMVITQKASENLCQLYFNGDLIFTKPASESSTLDAAGVLFFAHFVVTGARPLEVSTLAIFGKWLSAAEIKSLGKLN